MTRWTPGHSAALTRSPIVALNFHEIDAEHRDEVRRALRHVAGLGPRYDPDEPAEDEGPRVFVAFYDGMRDAALFGAEECDRLGLRAYFFPLFQHYDPHLANVTDDEWRQIAAVHEIGFHTASHATVAEVTPLTVRREVIEPIARIEALTGRPPRIGAWKGGTRFDAALLGNRTAREHGIRHLVSNWSIERVPAA
ncbi:polysaccharide deacetylase family protein [Paractinoplanes lichenicola]|uniref:Polysaccharide deacetylase family protein n=1 Tax=Paractinoplanes lichenicola TaxID=2802976 RepID=A0ABS1VGQ7_9ACTN|nr:polysaccharide deacetylase family protein [Actinoplanes lichenicola]MBL7253500.1 polysaccharide deacetylase family protein [Actinoplanes lichenicola]